MPLNIEQVLQRGPATSSEIQARTGMSQAGVSRQVRAMGHRIIRVKIGRSPHYMLTSNAFGGGDRHPLCLVDPDGAMHTIGHLRPLAHGGFYLEGLPGIPKVLLGVNGNGLFPGLPFFLHDLSPQGFIGRQIAQKLSEQADFPADPRLWSAEHVGRYLISNGDDLPGNLMFGGHAQLRLRRKQAAHCRDDYPRLAESAIGGDIPGSSAGGEQPKFTSFSKECSAHVIVKFSPKGDDAAATRWRDILLTEFYASEAIRAKGFPAAETRLVERDGRFFLESQRFDRVGETGRLPMISLLVVDAEFAGIAKGWHQVMKELHDMRLVSWEHFRDTAVLWCFGKLIHNTDMHLGNLSLGIDGDKFRLLPVYDMCSMGFAPISGEVRPYRFECPDLGDLAMFNADIAEEIKATAKEMARDFWNRIVEDPRVSVDFRDFRSRGNPVDLAQS